MADINEVMQRGFAYPGELEDITQQIHANDVQPQSWGNTIASGALKASDTLLFGLGDEIGAAGSAAINKYIKGYDGTFDEQYDQQLGAARGAEKQFANENPGTNIALSVAPLFTPGVGSAAAKLAGGLVGKGASAVGAAKLIAPIAKSDSLATQATKLARDGAGYGAAYGFGEGEDGVGQRLESAGEGALFGGLGSAVIGTPIAAAGKALTAAREAAPEWAEQFALSGFGSKASDFAKSAKQWTPRRVDAVDDATETTLKQSLLALKNEEGLLESAGDPIELFNSHALKRGKVAKDLYSVIGKADDELAAAGVKTQPSFNHAERYIETEGLANEIPYLKAELDKWKTAFQDEGDGTLTYLQSQKENLYGKEYPEGHKAVQNLDKAIARDLKDTIERITGEVLPPEYAGKVRDLNRRLGNFESAQPILARELGKAEGGTLPQKFMQFIRTSGGVFAPAIAGGVVGGLPGAALGLAAGATANRLASPKGAAMLAKGAEGLAEGSFAPTGQSLPRALGAIFGQFGPQGLEDDNSGVPQTAQQLQLKSSGPPLVPFAPSNAYADATAPTTANQGNPNGTDFESLFPQLVAAVKQVESSGNPNARSSAGAVGSMQLMPSIVKKFGVTNPLDDQQSTLAGARLLAEELLRFDGDIQLALAAYNMGSTKLNKAIKAVGTDDWDALVASGKIPQQTVQYVPKVLGQLG